MKNLYNAAVLNEIVERINKLQPESPREWGKMDVPQMLSHCAAALEVAVGSKNPPRLFIGRILSPFFKSSFFNEQPFKKNAPTDKSLVIIGKQDFEREKQRLTQLVKQFAEGGESKCTTHPHSFFGKLSPEQWSIGMYKHLDHHFRQFGV